MKVENTSDKLLGMLSLAARAGKLEFGSEAGQSAVRQGRARIVFVAEDAGDRTKKLMTDKCGFYKVPICCVGTGEALGKRLGKGAVSVVSVCDRNFANAIQKIISKI